MESCDLSKDDSKVIGIFIAMVKKGGYISDTNTLLVKVAGIIDVHLPVKSTQMPKMQNAYTKQQRMAINKGIRQLHTALDDSSPVWAYCQQYLYCKTGKRNTRTPSANKLNLAKMTLAIYA